MVDKIKQWVNKLSVKKKLIFYGYLIITPVLVFICAALLFRNYQSEKNKRFETDMRNISTLRESIGVLQSDIKDISTYICINNDIRKLLVSDNIEKLNTNAKLWLEAAPMEILQDMIALKGHIKTIAIYPENGIRPYLRGMDGSVYLSEIDTVRQTKTYAKTVESENGMLWMSEKKGIGELYETNRTDKIVLCREMFDLTRKKKLGYIVIGVQQEYFQTLCSNIIRDSREGVLILDPNGEELSKAGKLDKEVEEYLLSEQFIKEDYQKKKEKFVYKNYDILCCQIEQSASIICKVVPKYEIQMLAADNIYMPVVLLFGMLVGLLPLLIIISNIVTKPLRKVSIAINKFSEGDFEQQVEVTTNDEVGEVARCFNKMVKDIKNLIEENYVITLQEKESELAALQAQINPHFLYNTLDSLYWQAMGADNEEIAESILALSQLFRLVLGQGKREVTVGQETELVSRYLQIQKVRFSKNLNYEVNVDSRIKKMKIPKLILQPFVENAIVHGFENSGVPCYLSVSGEYIEGKIHFEIRDTGIGMRQDQIDEIWEEEPAQYAKQRIGRYAIKNIKERLQLRYHENFKLEIKSDVGKGTTVILEVPDEEGVQGCR